MELKEFFETHPRLALAFSGGVDSSYLLYTGLKWAEQLGIYYVKSAFQPEFERRDALRLADQLGAKVKVLDADVLSCREVAANPPDRCYYCKKVILSRIRTAAEADGFSVLIDGTNASDEISDRPGFRALREEGVLSPLRLCGMTKRRIRDLSREAGLFTWNKPAYACLATRVRTGEEIKAETLRAVEAGEDALRSLGFSDFRLRTSRNAAKLQFIPEQMETARLRYEEIHKLLSPYFEMIEIDPAGRKRSQ